ncbi:hypothetical protein V8G54_028060 [Vigna mungo]|uniref:Uncharacterized protein n=1 Tax=Vigna mungo TaxID=3915 RepID=A0AAQ3MSP2_VIGMU
MKPSTYSSTEQRNIICRWMWDKEYRDHNENYKCFNTYSLLGVFNALGSKLNLIEIERLIVKHVTLAFIPDQRHRTLLYEYSYIILIHGYCYTNKMKNYKSFNLLKSNLGHVENKGAKYF